MPLHRITFIPSERATDVPQGKSIAEAARIAGEPLPVECEGRGACGRCLVEVVDGKIPEYLKHCSEGGVPRVLACQTPVCGPLVVRPLQESKLPQLITCDRLVGIEPLMEWAPFPLELDSLAGPAREGDLGIAADIGTTTIRIFLIDLTSGRILGEAGRYNPQIPQGADVISRIVAAEKGQLPALAASVRSAVGEMVKCAARDGDADPDRVRDYVVAGNLTMIHLLFGVDPGPIRQVPPPELSLEFSPFPANRLGWPGGESARVRVVPAAGAWVGGDILSGILRAGFSRSEGGLSLYVDLGTNGEVALGGSEFALACACSAGPAFEGGGIRSGMRADRGAIDGACIDPDRETLELSVIGGGPPRGICGSGLISLAYALFRGGWIDRSGRYTERAPKRYTREDRWGRALLLSPDAGVALWERDLASLIRAKAAVFSGIRTLLSSLGIGAGSIERVLVSGNFGRFLNLPAAVGIGLLPDLPLERYSYVENGSLEGASLMLLSRKFQAELDAYRKRATYVDLSQFAGYMDTFVGASFLPHTDPSVLRE